MDRERSTLREPVFIGKKVKDDENLSHNLEDIHDRSDNERKGSSSLEFQTTERNLSAMKRNVIFTVLNNPSNQNNDNKNYSDLYFDSEKEENEGKANKRNDTFKSIITGRHIEDTSWSKLFLGALGIILLGFMQTIPLTLIPYRDLIQYPEYWWELLIPGSYASSIGFAFRCMFSGSYLNNDHLLRFKNMALVCLAGSVFMLFLLLTTYCIWTPILSYNYPIPFLGITTVSIGWVCSITVIWYLFPKKQRRSKNLQRRMRYVLLHVIFSIVIGNCYHIMILVIEKSSNQYQPILALALPTLREATSRISTKLIKNASNGDECGSMIVLAYTINTQYASMLCIVLGSLATSSTSWLLIGVDYLYNMWLCLKIVRTRKRSPQMIQEQIGALEELALCELVEFHVPLAFILVFLGASYGPNSGLFGGIGNSYWTYNAIEDINQALENMIIFFVVDFSSTIATGLILWLSCKINLWKVFNELQNEFGKTFCLVLGYNLLVVCTIFIMLLLIVISFKYKTKRTETTS